MSKKYNILKDKDSIINILEVLNDLCRNQNCFYCPFHEDRYCMVVVNGRTPMDYFKEDD